MQQYMLTVHSVDGSPEPSAEARQKVYQDVDVLNAELRSQGAWVFGAGAAPAEHRHRGARIHEGGELLMTDGPFAEGKEHVGGFWVIVAPDLDAALAWAAKATGLRCPGRGFAPSTKFRRTDRVPAVGGSEIERESSVRVRPRRGGPRARVRRHRPRRGGRPGRIRGGGGAVAVDWAATEPGRLDHHHCSQPSHRPVPTRGVKRTGTPRPRCCWKAGRGLPRKDQCVTTSFA